jgi:arabinose-5-phosphate isomerase
MSKPSRHSPDLDLIATARTALATEAQGLNRLLAALDGPLGDSLARAAALIAAAAGRVVVSGMGKSGHIGRKIAATLASTGTPALFVHPAEASHGDLGMITTQDVLLLLSNSGESAELRDLLAYSRRFRVPLIAMTARPASTLAREGDVVLLLPQAEEACPIGLAPTTSTLMQLALGDALAIMLLKQRGFTAEDFSAFHPGGKLGAQLKLVHEVMLTGDALPLVPETMVMSEALVVMTAKSLGCVGVTDPQGTLIGIITDGDLRRHMTGHLLGQTARMVMTPNPRTLPRDDLAIEALDTLNRAKITAAFIVDEAGRPSGLIHIHDLLRLGVS